MSETTRDFEHVLHVQDLSLIIKNRTILESLSFTIAPGEIFGILGEPGSGKTITARTIMGILPPQAQITGGDVFFKNKSITRNGIAPVRGKEIVMVFHNARSALNPTLKIGDQMLDILMTHLDLNKEAAQTRALDQLQSAGFVKPHKIFRSYVHQLSPDMAQRAMVVMATSCEPDLVIADDPVSLLKSSLQAETMKFIYNQKIKLGFALCFISHDIALLAAFADRIGVLKDGYIIEQDRTDQLLRAPKNSYTRQEINARLPQIVSKNETFKI